jgi:hypothetical protein
MLDNLHRVRLGNFFQGFQNAGDLIFIILVISNILDDVQVLNNDEKLGELFVHEPSKYW